MAISRIAVLSTFGAVAAATPSTIPSATAGYVSDSFELRFGPSSTFCSGRNLYNGKSAGQADCEAKCRATENCKFYNYWVSSGWCRLTDSCSRTGSVVGMKILVFALKPPKHPDYELYTEEARCEDASIHKSKTDGVEGCADLCLDVPECEFFSVLAGGWCKLTATCDDIGEQQHSDIYALSGVITTNASTGVESRTVARIRAAHANAISIEMEASVGKGPSFEPIVANVISTCTMQAIDPGHITFSYASTKKITATILILPPSSAELEQVFDRLESCDSMEAEIVEGLEAMGNREIVVDLDPPQLVNAAAPSKVPAALNTQGWCCLGSWLFDDPCSECTPSLTPRGVAARDHSCAGGEDACLSCSESWAEPTWCPGHVNHISI